jgi:hypothetical protein
MNKKRNVAFSAFATAVLRFVRINRREYLTKLVPQLFRR